MGLLSLLISMTVGLAAVVPQQGMAPQSPAPKPDETGNIVPHPTDDVEMDEAMEEARATLPRFFDLAESGLKASYLLKMRLTGGLRDEHVWMEVTSYAGGVFHGLIANDPLTPGYSFSDEVRLHTDDVEDWMVNTGQLRYGGYTLRVLLKSMDPAEAEMYRAQLRD